MVTHTLQLVLYRLIIRYRRHWKITTHPQCYQTTTTNHRHPLTSCTLTHPQLYIQMPPQTHIPHTPHAPHTLTSPCPHIPHTPTLHTHSHPHALTPPRTHTFGHRWLHRWPSSTSYTRAIAAPWQRVLPSGQCLHA